MALPTPRQFLQWYRDQETEPLPKAAPAVRANRRPLAEWLLAHLGLDSKAAFEQYLKELADSTRPTPFRFGAVVAEDMLTQWRAARGAPTRVSPLPTPPRPPQPRPPRPPHPGT